MFARRSTTALTLTCFAGCGWAAKPAVPFDPASVAWAKEQGTGTITGQGFYTQDQLPAPVTCAGAVVRLIPDTAYTEAQTAAWTAKIVWSDPPPPGHQPYTERACTCDAQGNFDFAALPAGKWIAFVSMNVKNREGYTMFASHANYRTFVETRPGETRKIVLTNPQ